MSQGVAPGVRFGETEKRGFQVGSLLRNTYRNANSDYFTESFMQQTDKKASVQTRDFLTPTFPQIAGSLNIVASGMFC